MRIRISAQSIDKINSDTIVLLYFNDERPLKGAAGVVDWKMNGTLSELIIKGINSGNTGETTLVLPGKRIKAKKLLFYGIGKTSDFNEGSLNQAVPLIIEKLVNIKCKDFCINLPSKKLSGTEEAAMAELMVKALSLKKNTEIDVTVLASAENIENVRKSAEEARKSLSIEEINEAPTSNASANQS